MVSPTTDRRLGLAGNTAIKTPVTVVATANLVLSAEQTIDGIACKAINAAGAPDRVLATAQTTASQNGIWDVSTGSWTRSIDANGNYDLTNGTFVEVSQGSNARSVYMLTTANPITVDTTAQTWVASPSVGFLAALASASDATKGAGLVGFANSLAYASGTVGSAIKLAEDGVNVLHYIPSALWPNILNYTSTDDLATYLQSAHTAEQSLVYPNGRFNSSVKITLRTDARVRGINRRGPQLRNTTGNTFFELPYLNVDVDLERLYWCGSANGVGTGVAVAATAGTFQGYTIGLRVHDCDFAAELAFGMDIDPIVCVIEKNSFGVDSTTGYNPSPGASTFVAMRAREYPATSNTTNVNSFRRNKVFHAGSLTVAAIQLATGANWVVEGNEIEQGGVAISSTDVNRLDVVQNWFEGNVVTNDLIVLSGSATTYTNVERNHFGSNTVGAGRGIINYASTVPTRVDAHGNDFGKNAGSYVLYDNSTTIKTLQGNGSVAFWDNTVSGDTVGDKCVSGTEFRGGQTSPRVVASINTVGPVLLSCSDPGATLGRNGVGDITLTVSHPLGTAANNVSVVTTGRTANAIRAVGVTTTTIQVQAFTDAGAAAETILGVVAYGS